MKQRYMGAAGLLLGMLACSVFSPAAPQPGVETIVAQTFEALTQPAPAQTDTAVPASPTALGGAAVAVNNINFVIPDGLASGAQAEHREAVLPAEDLPFWEYVPAHDVYLLQNYPLSGTFHEPRIYVYPANEYIQIVAEVETIAKRLSDILSAPDGQPLPPSLPFLPAFNAAQIFHSNEQIIPFQTGSGIRFLTQYGQAPMPVNNQEIFYTFQGLTSDGQYYIAAILPVHAPFLPADGNPNTPLPADGIPFDWNNFENTQQHFDLAVQKLNGSDLASFTPSLLQLDALIASIIINP